MSHTATATSKGIAGLSSTAVEGSEEIAGTSSTAVEGSEEVAGTSSTTVTAMESSEKSDDSEKKDPSAFAGEECAAEEAD